MTLQAGQVWRLRSVDTLGCQITAVDDEQVRLVGVRLTPEGPHRVPGMGPNVVFGPVPAELELVGTFDLVGEQGPTAWTQWGGVIFDLEAFAEQQPADDVGTPVLPFPTDLAELSVYRFFSTWSHPDGFVQGCRHVISELIQDVQAHPGDATLARYAFERAVSRLNALEEATALICEDEAHDLVVALEAVADFAGFDDLDPTEGRAW